MPHSSVAIPSCLTCGTCCFSNLEPYVRVTGDDFARLGEAAETLVIFHGHRAYMRMHDGHCAALRVQPDSVGEGGQFPCSVYETRPETCRALPREGPECAGELAAKSARPVARLTQIRLAALR